MTNDALFPFVNSILENKKDLLETGVYREEDYLPFLVNKALSQHLDCVLFADEMNTMRWLPEKLQYDYFLYAVPAAKRSRPKWAKKIQQEKLLALSRWFDINLRRAEELLKVLSHEQVSFIVTQIQRIDL